VSPYKTLQRRVEWMQSEDRLGVFLVALAVTAFVLGYVGWKAYTGVPIDQVLWALPVVCATSISMASLAGLFDE
jgi:hypothetical protein